ncbi:MAG: glycine cleavage system protein H [Promethearchaeota archaeon]
MRKEVPGLVNVDGYEVPDDYYYTELHTWARLEGDGTATVGVTTIGVKLAGNITHVRTKKVGMRVKQNATFGTMEAGKGVVRLPSPLSGEILEVNPALAERNLDPVNQDPYGAGWLLKMRVDDPGEVKNLIGGERVASWAAEEAKKVSK